MLISRKILILSLCLASYTLLFFSKQLFHADISLFRDQLSLFIPIEYTARKLAQNFELPLWNPWVVFGKPFAAEIINGVFYPPNWFTRLLPLPFGFNLSIAMHHFWAALGAGIFLLKRGFLTPVAILGAIVFAFSGFFISLDNLTNALYSASWLPWVLICGEEILSPVTQKSRRAVLLLGIVLAGSFLGGMPEFTLLSVVVLGIYLMAHGDFEVKGSCFKLVRRLTAASVVALGLSSVQLIPFVELVSLSSRSAGLNADTVLNYSLSFAQLKTLLPSMESVSGSLPTLSGQVPWILSLSVGPSLFFIFFCPEIKMRRFYFVIGSFLIFLFLASLGSFSWAHALVEAFSPLRLFRYPEKFLLVVYAIFIYGIAFGAERVFLLVGQQKRVYQMFSFLLPLLIALNLKNYSDNFLPLTHFDAFFEEATFPNLPGKSPDSYTRVYSNLRGIDWSLPSADLDRIQAALGTLQLATNFGVSNINIPSTINLLAHEDLFRILESSRKQDIARLLASFGVNWVYSVGALDYLGFSLKNEEQGSVATYANLRKVYAVSDPAPRAFLTRNIRVLPKEREQREFLRENPDMRLVVAVAEDLLLKELSVSDIPGPVDMRQTSAKHLELLVNSQKEALLVITNSFYPGWHAYVDGSEQKILSVNGMVQGLLVPEGSHAVELEFTPRMQILGLIVSALSLIMTLILLCGWFKPVMISRE